MELSHFYKRLFQSKKIEAALSETTNFFEVCWNPNISIEFIETIIDKSIRTIGTFQNSRLEDKNFWGISHNYYTTIEVILKFSQKYYARWSLNLFGINSNLNVEHVFLYPNIPWNFSDFGYNINTSLDVIEKYIENPVIKDGKNISEWDWDKISLNRNLTQEFIEKYIDKPWNWSRLSFISDIYSEAFLEKYIDKPWDFEKLSIKKNKINLALKYSHKHWDWDSLLYINDPSCENIEKIFEKNPNKTVNWSKISCNENISKYFFRKYNSADWDYYSLYRNEKFMKEILKDDSFKDVVSKISNPKNWNWKKCQKISI